MDFDLSKIQAGSCCGRGGEAPPPSPIDSFFDGVTGIFSAIASGNAWSLYEALSHPAAYILGIPFILISAYLLTRLFKAVPYLDKYLERHLMVVIYLVISAIIFIEVIRRFVFQTQAPWSTTLPPYLFLIMTWAGCAYNTKLRTHLSFSEMRMKFSRPFQMACLCLDAVLWLGFSLIVIITTIRQTANASANFQILLGTDNIMQWWFYIFVPLCWLVLCARVLQNLGEDIARYPTDKPLIQQAIIGQDPLDAEDNTEASRG